MKDDARVTVVYNFIMRSNMGFKQIYDGIITKFKEKRNIKKLVFNFEYIIYKSLYILTEFIDI